MKIYAVKNGREPNRTLAFFLFIKLFAVYIRYVYV